MLVLPTLCGAQVLPLLEGTDVAPPEFIEIEDADEKKIKVASPAYAAWIARSGGHELSSELAVP
jgi:hypothetical protein